MFKVVGGSGFIGTRLCSLLEERGLDFEIVDLKSSGRFPERTQIADIRDIEALREAVTGSAIINLAAVHRDDVRDRSEYYSTNVDGTRNLCDVASEKGIARMVFTSTVAVYGFCAPETDEGGTLNPFNDYGHSKLQAKGVLKEWHDGAPELLRPVHVRRNTSVLTAAECLSPTKKILFYRVNWDTYSKGAPHGP